MLTIKNGSKTTIVLRKYLSRKVRSLSRFFVTTKQAFVWKPALATKVAAAPMGMFFHVDSTKTRCKSITADAGTAVVLLTVFWLLATLVTGSIGCEKLKNG